MSNSDILVHVRGLNFMRAGRTIFKDVEINIQRGKITAIMGPSGTGKTTLLKLMSAQLKPSSGSVLFDGEDIHRLSRQQLFMMRKKVGMLFQSGALFSELTVFENVAFPLRSHYQLSEPVLRDIVLLKLQAVGLRAAQQLMPSQLSGGMVRRVALARAIALDPSLILYDEPFVGQDPISMGVLLRLIHSLNNALGLTSVVVSHDVKETMRIADYVYLIAEGVVVAEGDPITVAQSKDARVQQFMHGLADGPVPFQYPGASFSEDLGIAL